MAVASGNSVGLLGIDDGVQVWRAPPAAVPDGPDFAVGDVDGDGKQDIIFVNAANRGDSGVVTAFRAADGENVWSYQLPADVSGRIVAVGDIDGDLVDEVLVGATNNQLYALNARDNAILWRNISQYNRFSAVTIDDLDMDGRNEVVASSDFVAAYEGSTGKQIWSYGTGFQPTVILVADLDNDMMPEIVVGHVVSRPSVVGGTDGIKLADFSKPEGGDWEPDVAVADLNGDGLLDVVAAIDGSIVAFTNILRPAPPAQAATIARQADFAFNLYRGEGRLGGKGLNFSDLQGQPVVSNMSQSMPPGLRLSGCPSVFR